MSGPPIVKRWPRARVAERVSAACYGTVLVLATLPLLGAEQVASGLGWELVTGVGVATWVAHLYAEVVGDYLRHTAAARRREIGTAMADGLPILLAAVIPSFVLGLGRLEVLDEGVALWVAIVVAFLQLLGVGALVGTMVSPTPRPWFFAGVTAGVGIAVVAFKLALGH